MLAVGNSMDNSFDRFFKGKATPHKDVIALGRRSAPVEQTALFIAFQSGIPFDQIPAHYNGNFIGRSHEVNDLTGIMVNSVAHMKFEREKEERLKEERAERQRNGGRTTLQTVNPTHRSSMIRAVESALGVGNSAAIPAEGGSLADEDALGAGAKRSRVEIAPPGRRRQPPPPLALGSQDSMVLDEDEAAQERDAMDIDPLESPSSSESESSLDGFVTEGFSDDEGDSSQRDRMRNLDYDPSDPF